MTVVLVLLCLAIAGRELYLAFERRRPGNAPEIADIRTQLAALKDTRDELERFRAEQRERVDRLAADQEERLERLTAEQTRENESLRDTDARIRSLISQINDRMVPDVNDRLARHRETIDRLGRELSGLRGHLVGRLDQAVAASLGADPADLVAGTLTAEPATARPALAGAYERFAGHYGLHVELAHGPRYYLSGRSPRGLERDFIELLQALRTDRPDTAATEGAGESGGIGESTEAAQALLAALNEAERGGAQIGPLVIVRTPGSLLCGVLPLAELRRSGTAGPLDDPAATAVRLRRLPEGRFCDTSARAARTTR